VVFLQLYAILGPNLGDGGIFACPAVPCTVPHTENNAREHEW
jgi:hypothetical protein